MNRQVFKQAQNLQPGDCTATYEVMSVSVDGSFVKAVVRLFEDDSIAPRIWDKPETLVKTIAANNVIEGFADESETKSERISAS